MAIDTVGKLSPVTFYTIKEAIHCGRCLRLTLAEGEYLVEPHVLGRSRSGKTLLRAYQLRGPNRAKQTMRWKLFELKNIKHAVEVDDRFCSPRPGYRSNDPTMSGGIIERL